ncbi:MAG: hypothetical protein NTZ29_17310, partial [Verrucomicrobia bacterium]|nr:hypothetical protein [Verrucomicrobiota bacterium]
MKRLLPLFILALTVSMIIAPFALAAESAKAAPAVPDRSPGAPIAGAISTVTGMAISPLLGTGAYGAYQYFSATTPEQKAALPWFAQWAFFGPALLIVGACAAKDALGAAVPPGMKKPLDVLETIENKATGLVAAGAVVPFTMAAVSKMMVTAQATGDGGAALAPTGLAMLQVGAIDFSWLLNLLTVPFGIAMFAVVWMASHAINVLILLSPWGAIDAALKGMRTGLLGLLALSATINPWLGAALSLLVIIVAWLVAGWAFRLTFFGSVFCWDFFTLRRTRFTPKENDNKMFAGGNLPGVPPRTYGRLALRTAGGLEFYYRPWLVMPERSAVVATEKSDLAVGKGLFFSSITANDRDTLFLLPPRYHGHEETLARAYLMGGGVRAAGLRKAWGVLRELFGGSAAKTQVV